MQPANFSLPLRRNAAAPMHLSLVTLDEAGAEIPMNLNGYSLKLEVRLYQGAPGDPQLSLSSMNGLIGITDPALGDVMIDWPAVLTRIAAMPSTAEAGDPTQPRVDTFAYDLLLMSADGASQAILEGQVPVSFGVTQNG